ncbi:MAG: hypothetical protein JW982_16225 [Spirochaetes bacterium]|nr:hypothetical protein [Spirochaetota bacterium]
MIKKLFRLILIISVIAGIIAGSWFFSRRVYIFYNRIYFGVLQKDRYEQYVQKAADLLKNKKYREFEILIDKITVSYPEPVEAFKLEAEYYSELNQEEKALSILLRIYEGDERTLSGMSDILRRVFRAGMYGDVIGELKDFNLAGNQEFEFYYGASLCEEGDYANAIKYLDASAKDGYDRYDLYYYRAYAYYSIFQKTKPENVNYLRQAEMNAEAAFKEFPEDVETRKLLLNIYNSQKKFEAAAAISRDLLK